MEKPLSVVLIAALGLLFIMFFAVGIIGWLMDMILRSGRVRSGSADPPTNLIYLKHDDRFTPSNKVSQPD